MKIKSKQMPSLNEGKIYIGDSSNNATNSAYTLPTSDGSANQVLTTDGSGAVTFQDASGGISNIVEDTTPQLGGNLDLNSKAVEGHLIPSLVDTYDLGSTAAEWRNLYLGDGGAVYFGNDSDTILHHAQDQGLILQLISASENASEPKFELRNMQAANISGPVLVLNHQGSDANGDYVGYLRFNADTSTTNTAYSYITTRIEERDHATRAAKIQFALMAKGATALPLELIGNSSTSETETKVNDYLNIADHNGTTGLKLAGTLVTTTAAELNILDGDTSATPTTLADTDRAIVNDAGTMKQVAFSDIKAYIEANADLITGQTAETAIADNDLVLIYDTTAGALRKMTKANLVAGLGSGGGGFTYSRVASDVATAAVSTHYSVDVSSNNVTITLPALSSNNVTEGQEIRVKVYNQASSYKVIIAPASGSGDKIDSSTSNFELTVKNQAITLVASDHSAGHDSWEII